MDNTSNKSKHPSKISEDEESITDEYNIFEPNREVCIVTAGSVDSGKSTLIGTFVTDKTDDGNGSLRKLVAKHKHEIVSGKTSDISTSVLHRKLKDGDKELVMVDLCGHRKYLGTTIYGMTGYFPDYGILIIAANKGVLPMTREHINVLNSLHIPFAIFITREDIAPPGIFERTCKSINREFKHTNKKLQFINGSHKITLNTRAKKIICQINKDFDDPEPILEVFNEYCDGGMFRLNSEKVPKDDIDKLQNIINETLNEYQMKIFSKLETLAKDIKNNPYLVPIITISNKTGYCLEAAKNFTYNLEPRKDDWSNSEESVFYIEANFEKPGIGLIISGILRGKDVKVGDTMYIGPYGTKYVKIKIWSIHDNNRQTLLKLTNAHRGCFAIRILDKKVEFKRKDIRRGMVVISNLEYLENLCYEFEAKINILHHSNTIHTGFSPNIIMANIKQSARIIIPDSIQHKDKDGNIIKPCLRTGDCEVVKFRFLYAPEIVKEGYSFIFKEEQTRGDGHVVSKLSILNDTKGPAARDRYKNRSKKTFKVGISKGNVTGNKVI
jgi:elongation factor 1-alpha